MDVPGPYPLADGANFFPAIPMPAKGKAAATPSPAHGPLAVTLTPQRAQPDQWVSKPGSGSISVNADLLSGTLDVALDGPRGGVHLSGTWECLALSSGGHPGSGPITGPSPATTSSGTPTMVPAR